MLLGGGYHNVPRTAGLTLMCLCCCCVRAQFGSSSQAVFFKMRVAGVLHIFQFETRQGEDICMALQTHINDIMMKRYSKVCVGFRVGDVLHISHPTSRRHVLRGRRWPQQSPHPSQVCDQQHAPVLPCLWQCPRSNSSSVSCKLLALTLVAVTAFGHMHVRRSRRSLSPAAASRAAACWAATQPTMRKWTST